jgi:hypothetical protein
VKVVVNGTTLTAKVSGTTWKATVPARLLDGSYQVQATVTDAAGNTASATAQLTVDTVSPKVTAGA